MPSATTALGTMTTQSQSANKESKMTINDKIANEIICAEKENGSIAEWEEVIDEFAFNEAEQMTYGWDLDDDQFEGFKNNLKEAILALVDFSEVEDAINVAQEEAKERVGEWLNNRQDWGWE